MKKIVSLVSVLFLSTLLTVLPVLLAYPAAADTAPGTAVLQESVSTEEPPEPDAEKTSPPWVQSVQKVCLMLFVASFLFLLMGSVTAKNNKKKQQTSGSAPLPPVSHPKKKKKKKKK